MNEVLLQELFRNSIVTVLKLASPMLFSALIVGLIIAIFQATTQIQEQTLAFVPKVFAIFIVLLFLSSWILRNLVEFTNNIFDYIDYILVLVKLC